MTDFKSGGVPTPDYDSDDVNYISEKTEFTDDVFVYGKLYADLGGDVQTFSTAGVERVRITKEGDVAIGSNNPNVIVDASNTSILSVGIVTAREFYGIFKGSIDPAVANDKISEGNSAAEVIDSGSDGRFIVTTEGVERFLIYANGKVVIPSGNTNGNFVRDTEDTYQWNGTDTNANIPDSSIGLQIRNNDQTTHKTAALAEFRTYRNSSTANPGVVYIGAVDPGDGNAHRSDFIVALKNGSTTVNERLRIKHDGVINCGHGDEINLHGTTTTGINLNGNNNSGQIIANASGNRALIIGRQGSYGQVIEFFQGTNTNEAAVTIPAADTLGFETNGTENFRVTSQGRVRIKCEDMDNDPWTTNRGVMIGDSSTGSTFSNGSATGMANNIIFANGNGLVGKISTNGSTTTYHTSSDYRVKENAVSISDGIARLKTLKPYKFNFKADPSTTLDGFFAHEVSSAVPEAVDGEKDELYTEDYLGYKVGDQKLQTLDSSKLIPLLTAALQEAITKIETLEIKVATLEGS